MNYTVAPGLYCVGSPTEASPVLVTANYRLTCDVLRKAMEKENAWVLVLDTKGINVWCAAGKGTFGTAELVGRIARTGLANFVGHRTLILPQLGAPGVAGHEVTKATGFHVVYGPIRASDIPAFLKAGNKATAAMRTVGFDFAERCVLVPMELFPALRKFLWVIVGTALVTGLFPEGILFKPALAHSWPILAAGLTAVLAGTVAVPLLLPWIPFRGFAAKGALSGAVLLLPLLVATDSLFFGSYFLSCGIVLFFTAVASYLALNFTGCTPFTNISGVKKEMRFAVPAYLAACAGAGIFIILFKLNEWGLL
jgi:acetyl-CoA decarbonylase/synthase complex subunit gamma